MFDFIKTELTEARLFPNPGSINGRSASELAHLLFSCMLTLEIMHHKHEANAFSYVQKTMAFKDFDHMRSGGTDLANLIAVMGNQNDYDSEMITNLKLYAPMLQIKAYFRSFGWYSNTQIRQFFLQLESDLMIGDSMLRQARRTVTNWELSSELERSMAWSAINREFNRHGSQLDLYVLAKMYFNT
jgi:hypothetical protein